MSQTSQLVKKRLLGIEEIPTHDQPRKHIGFLKVHKAASTTTQAIFLRFGWKRNLTFILPPEWNAFGYPNIISTNESLTKYNTLPPPPGKIFDILCNHVVYDKASWDEFLPTDSAIIGTVRQPYTFFKSSMNYFSPAYIDRIQSDDKVGEFLAKPQKYEKSIRRSFLNNRQAFEYGVDPDIIEKRDIERFDNYLHGVLDKVFDMVIVAEKFDESLVLMRRKLNWELFDIMYAIKNVRNVKKPSKWVHKPEHEPLHQNYSKFDYLLYDFFAKKLDREIANEGVSFEEELKHFKDTRAYIENFCHEVPKQVKAVVIAPSQWNDQFEVTREECTLMHRGEIDFTQRIRVLQYGTATWKMGGKPQPKKEQADKPNTG